MKAFGSVADVQTIMIYKGDCVQGLDDSSRGEWVGVVSCVRTSGEDFGLAITGRMHAGVCGINSVRVDNNRNVYLVERKKCHSCVMSLECTTNGH